MDEFKYNQLVSFYIFFVALAFQLRQLFEGNQ